MKKLLLMLFALITTGAWAQTDVTATYIVNPGFESCTARTDNLAAGGSAVGDNYADAGWTLAQSASWCSSAVVEYGGTGQVNGVNAPSADNAGNSGKALGVSVGWGGTNKYQSTTAVTLPAGHYVLTVNAHNRLSGKTQFKSVNGFVATNGTSYLSTKTSFTYNSWVTDVITFDLTEATEGKFQIGGTAISGGSGDNAKVFFDNLTLTWTDPLQAAKDALQAEIDKAKLCDAKEGLADAIAAAENALNNATTNTELQEALAALQVADKDAVLRYENGLADAAATNGMATNFVVNGTFDSGISPWQRTGTYQNNKTANNQAGDFTGNFYENWNGSAQVNKMYQTINNIPNGTYKLKIAAFVNTLADPNESQYVFANDDKVYLTTSAPTFYEVWTVVTGNTVEVGLEQTTATANWMGIDNVTLTYYGAGDVRDQAQAGSHKTDWDEALAAARAAIANADYSNVTGSEKTVLQTEIAKAEPTTAEGYVAATAALTEATNNFIAAKANYDALVTEIAYAKTINVTTTDAEAVAAASETTATSALTATQALKVLEYNTINTNYPNDVTSLLGTWSKGNYDEKSGQSYQGGDEKYFDKWNASAMDLTSSATVTLPAGKYVVKVAGRGVSTTAMSLSVKVGEDDAISTPFLMNGDTGKGIDTAGDTNFSDEGTYSNNNNGRGWEYRYITFETDGTSEITIAINGHLNNGTWQSFYAPVLLCDDATAAANELANAKAELQNAINEAPAVATANVGSAAFQLPTEGVNTYSDALITAQAAHDSETATMKSIASAKTALESAIAAYKALEINAPAEGQLFNVVLTYGGWTYDNKAMTYIAGGRTDAGLYNIQYKEEANQNLAQAFTFTKVEGNNYKMSQIDADGNVRYMTTGVPYGGNTGQIRTSTTADDAMLVTVIPTATDGVWNLKNTEADNYIGSQDAGVFTVNSHIDFKLVETTKPSIVINTTNAGWGTTMLPFAAEKPADVKVYTCAELSGEQLSLVEVDALEANKPYIIEGAWNATLTGDAQGTALTYKEGVLTGVYATTVAPTGSYVMQKLNDKVGFYKVSEEKPINVPANRAYVTVAGSEVKAFYLDGATGINGVFDALQNGDIYDLAGRKVQHMQKGNVYIVNGKKVVVK